MKVSPELKVFVGGIGIGTTEEDIKKYFEQFGGKVILVSYISALTWIPGVASEMYVKYWNVSDLANSNFIYQRCQEQAMFTNIRI